MRHNRIKELRKKNKLTMQALADKVGTTASQINKLEKGERRLTADWMYRLADAFEVAPVDIFPRGKNEAKKQTEEQQEADFEALVLNTRKDDKWSFFEKSFENKLPANASPALIQIKQDDLEPDVSRGDYVLINTNDKNPETAGVFVTLDKLGNYIMRMCRLIQKDGNDYIQTIDVEKVKDSKGKLTLKKTKSLKPATEIQIAGRILAHWHWL
jgi:transcriptional regulator with XRE-family HTH domain